MAEARGHDRLINRYSFAADVVCETGLHIGTGRSGDALLAGSDLPIARDGARRPYIPGSSFRGVLRSGLESLLRGLDGAGVRVCNPFETGEKGVDRACSELVKTERDRRKDRGEDAITEEQAFALAWEKSCAICCLFGQLFLASRVRVADLPMAGDGGQTYVRDGVGLDRDLRTAAKGVLYDFEAVPVDSRFRLHMELENGESHEVGLLLTGLDLFGQGGLTLGGKGARGLGIVRVEGLEVRRRTARDFFDGTGQAPLGDDELAGFREAARAHYVEGGR